MVQRLSRPLSHPISPAREREKAAWFPRDARGLPENHLWRGQVRAACARLQCLPYFPSSAFKPFLQRCAQRAGWFVNLELRAS